MIRFACFDSNAYTYNKPGHSIGYPHGPLLSVPTNTPPGLSIATTLPAGWHACSRPFCATAWSHNLNLTRYGRSKRHGPGAANAAKPETVLPWSKPFQGGETPQRTSGQCKHASNTGRSSLPASVLTDSRAGNESCALRIDQGRRLRWGLLHRVRLLFRRIHRCRFISA